MTVKSQAHYDRLKAMVQAGSVSKEYFDTETRDVIYSLLPDRLPPGRKAKVRR